MGLVAKRRELTKRTIDQNPVTMALTRFGKVPDGAGGWTEGEIPVDPQVFRIFISSNRGSRNISQEGGQMQINQVGLLAEHDADIKKDDRFELGGRRYKVARITPVRLYGDVVSVQCDLEEVV